MNIKNFVLISVLAITLLCVGQISRAELPQVLGNSTVANKAVHDGNIAYARGDITAAEADFKVAISVTLIDWAANRGLARCYAADENYVDAAAQYAKAGGGYGNDIDFLTEALLVMQKAGAIQQGILYYNKALDLCEKGYSADKMETYPSKFLADGSNYDAAEMTAVAHIMRGLNTGDDDSARILYEQQQALAADPNSPIVKYYDSYFISRAKEDDETAAANRGLAAK